MREPVQPGQQGLHVGQIIDQVGQENVVVLFLGGKLLSVGGMELQVRMTLTRQVNNRGAEIDTDAAGGPDGGQKIAQAATEFQDAQTGRDQKAEVGKVMADLLAPFRKPDADEAMKLIHANGFDNLHMAFYKNHDIGNDGVWDVWQIEGPAMLWYFRGEPHVHTWVNIRKHA